MSIEVNGVDINAADFAVDFDEFCYDQEDIILQGVQYVYDLSGITDTINLNSGQFVSDQTGNLGTNIGQAVFDPSAQHDAFHGNPAKFLNRSSVNLTLGFTDANSCFTSINVNLFVNPEPEVLPVTGLSSEDLAFTRPTNNIRLSNFCEGTDAVTAEIKIIDPLDADPGDDEEDDYAGYTFDWTVGGSAVTDLDLDTLANTLEFVPSTSNLIISVTVTDFNGCFETFSEVHRLQNVPDLDIPELIQFEEFCSDDVAPILTLEDFENSDLSANTSSILSWEVLSYDTDRTDTVDNPVSNAWAEATVAQNLSGNSIPQIDLKLWHEGAGGAAFVDGKSVGGNSTVHTIYITYLDSARLYQGQNTNCEVTYAQETIIINPSPDISFTLEGLDEDNIELCYDDASIVLTGTNAVTGAPIGSGVFEIPGISISTNNGVAVFNAADVNGSDPYAGRSEHTVNYTYQDGNGCQQTVSKTFFVNPRPEFVGSREQGDVINGIQVLNSCASADIKVYVEMVDNKDLYVFEWRVNGNIEQTLSGSVGGDTLVYALGEGETSANFRVTATYDPDADGAVFATQCSAEAVSRSVTVGQEPTPTLKWVGLSAGHPRGTDFVINQENPGLPNNEVTSVELAIYDFDDTVTFFEVGDPNNPINLDIDAFVIPYSFEQSGTYRVELRMTTTAGCDVTIQRDVNILPHYTSFSGENSYTQNFEGAAVSPFDLTDTDGDGGWHIERRNLNGKADSLITTWQLGDGAPGSNETRAVYTDYGSIDNPDVNREISFVYSPSFDMSGFDAPTLSIQRYSGFTSDRDGAVLQYSEDDGRTWINVGLFNPELSAELASTPGWYSRNGITAAPGTQGVGDESADNDEGIGWAIPKGVDINDDNGFDWQEGITKLGFTEPSFVRFRFALAGQAGEKEGAEGFGFDEFRLFDQTQVVLVELFSSSLDQNSIDFNRIIEEDPNFTGSDVILVNYYTDFGNGGRSIDELNRRNTNDPGAKSSFYGISSVPSLAIKGTDALSISLDLTDTENTSQRDIDALVSELRARVNNAKLQDPAFYIELRATVDADNNLVVNANYTALKDLDTSRLSMSIAVIEPEYPLELQDTVGLYVGPISINNVFRKSLPTAAGAFYEGVVSTGEVLRIEDEIWPIKNMEIPDNFRVVAYIQDLDTREVYQSISLNVTGGDNVLSAQNSLQGTDISIYPNPADKEVTIDFVEPLLEETEWVIFDQSGREVMKGALSIGTKTMTKTATPTSKNTSMSLQATSNMVK